MSLKKNTLWNLAGSGLPLIAAAFCIPYLLKGMGKEMFGILTLIWALIGYFSLFDLGVGRSLTYEVSKLLGDHNTQDIKPTLKAGLIITLITGFIGAGFLYLISPNLSKNWLNINLIYQKDALIAFNICALAIIPTTITSGLRGALEGHNNFFSSNIIKLLLGFGMFALPALSYYLYGASLTNCAWYLFILRAVIACIAFIQVQQCFKNYQASPSLPRSYFKRLFNYGFWITVTGIISPLMVYGDRFLISKILGAAQLSYYSIPQEGLFRMLILPAALSGALMPTFTALKGTELQKIYQDNFKRIAYIMLAVCILAAILAYPAMSWWLSVEFAKQSIGVTVILCFGIWINSMAQMPYTLIQACGNPEKTAIFHIIELLVYIPLILILVNYFGLIGAGIAWFLRVLIDFILLEYTSHKILLLK